MYSTDIRSAVQLEVCMACPNWFTTFDASKTSRLLFLRTCERCYVQSTTRRSWLIESWSTQLLLLQGLLDFRRHLCNFAIQRHNHRTNFEGQTSSKIIFTTTYLFLLPQLAWQQSLKDPLDTSQQPWLQNQIWCLQLSRLRCPNSFLQACHS